MPVKSIILILSVILPFVSCNSEGQSKQGKNDFVISNDKKKLGEIIDLSTFSPFEVQFLYAPKGKHDGRDLIPGPTDYRLEAVLYFKIRDRVNRNGCSPVEQNQFSRDDFNFSWLSEEIKNELNKMPVDSKGNNASCFYKGVLMHGSCFYLGNKLLLLLFTN
jgi:hypothetical protein